MLLPGCGGGSPLGNPPDVTNSSNTTSQKLSFFYYETCINPIFDKLLPIVGSSATNTCSASSCHDSVNGTGGAFRVVAGLSPTGDYVNPTQSAAAIRASNMAKNFYTAQGETTTSAPLSSRLLIKPLVLGISHVGGQVFPNLQDVNVKLIQYWITHPVPQSQDEFSTGAAVSNMFTPPIDPTTFDPSTFNPSRCNTQ